MVPPILFQPRFDKSDMDVFWTKILCAALSVVLSLVFGFLPWAFRDGACAVNIDPAHPDYKSRRRGNQILAFLLNFSGGVLLANCFCHWLPEVVEEIEHEDLDTVLPVAEIVMVCGFLFICFLEELIHFLLHRYTPQGQKEREEKKMKEKASFQTKEKNGFANGRAKVAPEERCNGTGGDVERKGEEEQEEDAMLKENAREFDGTLSAIRTFFVVFALSFHSVIEGLALGLEEEASGVWLNFGALALHKFVIAFAVGVELVAVQASKINYAVSMGVFSFAPALGVAIGMALTGDDGETKIENLAIQLLQAVATGTIVYVVFFEIFPMARRIGGSGFRSVLAMTIGFGSFLPSLLFHNHEHDDEEECI